MIRGLIKRSLARFGLHLVRNPQVNTLDTHLLDVFSALGVNCVLDVGAHDGGYGAELRRLGFNGHIVSFEPISTHFARLEERIAGDSRWTAHRLALGDRDGDAEINVLSGATFSSFLSPSSYGARGFGPKMQMVRKEQVPLRRLESVFDDVLSGVPDPRVFLKMDTQGYDLVVIRGAGAKLQALLGVQMELAIKEIYEGMSTAFTQAIPALQGLGFELTGLFPVSREPANGLALLEMDCVMVASTSLGHGMKDRFAADAHCNTRH
jgi:FkbM family methyltransferase